MEVKRRLQEAQNQLDLAIAAHSQFRQDAKEWDALYNGTRKIRPQTTLTVSDRFNSNDYDATEDARQVVNIVFQLIESQIDTSVPKPLVQSREEDDEFRRRMVEGMLSYMTEGPHFRRLNSENERIVRKNGMCIYKVIYNPDTRAHNWRGEIKVINPHPLNIIPQPGVHRLQDMDYFFHIENRTIDQICRMYGEEFREKLQDVTARYEYLEELGDEYTSSSNNTSTQLISVVEKWFKDKDGDIGVHTWADEVELRYIPKFFYKRDTEGNIITTEQVEVPVYDEETGEEIDREVAEVECYVPKRYPFVVQYNIPKEKSFRGKSDAEIIYDQQESIKKMLSMEEEKQIKGTTKIITRKGSGLKDKINNAVTQVLETDDPLSDVKVVELKTHDDTLVQRYQLLVQAAKDTLGITDAYQGKLERSNISGRAIEQLTENSLGRALTKKEEKELAYAELYQILYDFVIAFYDEVRPFRVKGPDNKPIYGYFDKGKLLKRDIAGQYYYPEFDIHISADMGLPRDKKFIMNSATEALQYGALTPVGYWTILESIDYPNASKMLEIAKQLEGVQQGQEMEAVLATLNQMRPETREMFLSKPLEEQIALLQQVINGVENKGGE